MTLITVYNHGLTTAYSLLLTGSIARSTKLRLFDLLRGRFWFFRLTAATRCTDEDEIWQGGGVTNFTSIGAEIRV